MLGIVASLHTPELGDLIKGVSIIDLVVSEHVQGFGMCLFKGLADHLVFLCRVGEVAELDQGVGIFFLHGIEEGLQSCRAIVHHVLMQVGDHAELDRFFDSLQTGHDPLGQDNRGRHRGGGAEEVTS